MVRNRERARKKAVKEGRGEGKAMGRVVYQAKGRRKCGGMESVGGRKSDAEKCYSKR